MSTKNNKVENHPLPNQSSKVIKKTDLKSIADQASKNKKSHWINWPIKILVISTFLSLAFSTISEIVLSRVGLIISFLTISFLLIVNILSDMVGVATAACPIEQISALKSRRVKGANTAIFLIKNAEKVSSICNDVIGDICGILSGAAGSAIAIKLISNSMNNSVQILIAASFSALTAGLTIFGKAICKKYALDNSTKIVLKVGIFLNIFNLKKK